MEGDEKLRQLLQVPPSTETKTRLTEKAMRRAGAGVGQRDTLLFAIVRIWTVIAELFAPVFAQLAERQARFSAGKPAKESDQDKSGRE